MPVSLTFKADADETDENNEAHVPLAFIRCHCKASAGAEKCQRSNKS